MYQCWIGLDLKSNSFYWFWITLICSRVCRTHKQMPHSWLHSSQLRHCWHLKSMELCENCMRTGLISVEKQFWHQSPTLYWVRKEHWSLAWVKVNLRDLYCGKWKQTAAALLYRHPNICPSIYPEHITHFPPIHTQLIDVAKLQLIEPSVCKINTFAGAVRWVRGEGEKRDIKRQR